MLFMKFIVLCLLLVAFPRLAFTRGYFVPTGKVFLSPDKTKSIKLLDYDREYHYVITDRKTGKATVLDRFLSPIFAIAWSPDSRSIYVAEHIANGLVVEILHLSKDRWDTMTLDYCGKRHGLMMKLVLDMINQAYIQLVSKIGLVESKHGTHYRCYLASYDVDPVTGETSNLRKRNISVDDCYSSSRQHDGLPQR